jgi:hypothetical protein
VDVVHLVVEDFEGSSRYFLQLSNPLPWRQRALPSTLHQCQPPMGSGVAADRGRISTMYTELHGLGTHVRGKHQFAGTERSADCGTTKVAHIPASLNAYIDNEYVQSIAQVRRLTPQRVATTIPIRPISNATLHGLKTGTDVAELEIAIPAGSAMTPATSLRSPAPPSVT